MTKASDNLFPKVLLDMQTSAPAAPSDADWKLYAMPDGIYARSSNSAVGPFGTGGTGNVAADGIWDAKGDLAVGTAANTAARLAVGTSNGMSLVVASGEATGLKWRTSEWDTIIVKASDDTVTNSAVLASDSELSWAVGATTDVWRFDLMVLYNSTLTGDYKCNLVASAGSFTAAYRYLGSDTTANAVLVSTGIRISAGSSLTDIAAGGTAAGTVRFILIEGVITAPSQAFTMNFKFAQNTQTAAESAVTLIGSTLKLKQLR